MNRNTPSAAPRRFFVLMGVSGTGKTTVGRLAARELGAGFIEADDYHSPENIRTMTAGIGLTDEQRWPWLEALCKAALAAAGDKGIVVIACSALKKRYRDYIRNALSDPIFFHLHADEEVIRARMTARKSHFMAASMLEGQFADLEVPDGEADVHPVDVEQSADEVAEEVVSICRKYL